MDEKNKTRLAVELAFVDQTGQELLQREKDEVEALDGQFSPSQAKALVAYCRTSATVACRAAQAIQMAKNETVTDDERVLLKGGHAKLLEDWATERHSADALAGILDHANGGGWTDYGALLRLVREIIDLRGRIC